MAILNERIKDSALVTPLSNIFIDKYMLKANATFVKVYIYGYRNCYYGKCDITFKQIAEDMDILESDVLLAWKYWQEQGIVKLHFDSKADTYDVEYLPLQADTFNVKEKIKYSVVATKPTYLPQELDIYNQNSDEVRDLFKYAQKTLNKLLTYQDMNMIFSFYDWLRLPIDVIKIMLAYYCDKSMNYIEKVAVGWADEGIDTVDKAEEKIQRGVHYSHIMKALGMAGNLTPSPKEIEFMRKWIEVYRFSIDIIKEACQRAAMNVSQHRFSYADGILKNWHEGNIKTLEEVKALDQLHLQKQKSDSPNRINGYTTFKKQNRFINYEQGEWDFEKLEKLEREYIDKNLER